MKERRARERPRAASILAQLREVKNVAPAKKPKHDVLVVKSLGEGLVTAEHPRRGTTRTLAVPPCDSVGTACAGGRCERLRTSHMRRYNARSRGDFYRSPCICGCATKTLVSQLCCSCWAFCCDEHWVGHDSYLAGLSDGYKVHRRLHEFLGAGK